MTTQDSILSLSPFEKPCSICGDPIDVIGTWQLGHNAQPVNNGRCCSKCNAEVVIPARIALEQDRRNEEPETRHMSILFDDDEPEFQMERNKHINTLRDVMLDQADDPIAFISALITTIAAVLSSTEEHGEMEQAYRAINKFLRAETSDMLRVPKRSSVQ